MRRRRSGSAPAEPEVIKKGKQETRKKAPRLRQKKAEKKEKK